jgi:hypothetical protein
MGKKKTTTTTTTRSTAKRGPVISRSGKSEVELSLFKKKTKK